MHDIETHTEDYLVLVPEGRGIMAEYMPNDWLGGVMQALEDRWFGYVDALNERSASYLCPCMTLTFSLPLTFAL